MRFGRKTDEASQALSLQKEHLKQATTALENAATEREKRIDLGLKVLKQANAKYKEEATRASRALADAAKPVKVAGGWMSPVTVFDDRIKANGKTLMLRADVEATVDTAGNLSRTRRYTLTRFALLGPFSVFTPKGTKHDDRELFLLIESAEWAELVKCKNDQQAQVRSLAQSINLASRQLEKALADRRQRVEIAQRSLDDVRRNTDAVEQARREVQAIESDRHAISERRGELERLVKEYPDEGSKDVAKARKALAAVDAILARALELPPVQHVEQLAILQAGEDDDIPVGAPVDVVLTNPGAQKIAVIKVVREWTKLGLKEAKDIVDSSELGPAIVARGVEPSIAAAIVDGLTLAGGMAVRSASESPPLEASAEGAQPDENVLPSRPRDDDVIGQIKRLGELRDGGLITPEEFEAKKAELLDRI
jgi:ribosomal protein L7/L12